MVSILLFKIIMVCSSVAYFLLQVLDKFFFIEVSKMINSRSNTCFNLKHINSFSPNISMYQQLALGTELKYLAS